MKERIKQVPKITGSRLILLLLTLLVACGGDPQEQLLRDIEENQQMLESIAEEGEEKTELVLETADLFEEYVTEYPDDTANVHDFYYEAIRLNAVGGNYEKSMALVDSFRSKYPKHRLAPIVLHMKGFLVYEVGMKDETKARTVYEEFLATYPDHELVPDVLFSLENLGKSEKEVMEEIMRKAQSNGEADSSSGGE